MKLCSPLNIRSDADSYQKHVVACPPDDEETEFTPDFLLIYEENQRTSFANDTNID